MIHGNIVWGFKEIFATRVSFGFFYRSPIADMQESRGW